MKNEKENSRNQEGLPWITIGLLLIAATLFLVYYNLYDELQANSLSNFLGHFIRYWLFYQQKA